MKPHGKINHNNSPEFHNALSRLRGTGRSFNTALLLAVEAPPPQWPAPRPVRGALWGHGEHPRPLSPTSPPLPALLPARLGPQPLTASAGGGTPVPAPVAAPSCGRGPRTARPCHGGAGAGAAGAAGQSGDGRRVLRGEDLHRAELHGARRACLLLLLPGHDR